MSQKKQRIKLKVGVFILAGVVCLFAYVALIGDDKTYFSMVSKYKIKFETVDGLFVGSAVRINGISVGNVSDIHFVSETGAVQVVVSVLRKFTSVITDKSTASLRTKGLLGDKYISIITKGKQGRKLAKNSFIPTKPVPGVLGTLGTQATGEKISAILDELLIFTRALNSEQTVRQLSQIAKDMSRMFSENKSQEISQTLKILNNILKKIDEGEGTAGALINNKRLYNRVISLLGGRPYHKYLPSLVEEKNKNPVKKN